jgi:hypothetical protein
VTRQRLRSSLSTRNLRSKFLGLDQGPSVEAGAAARAGLFMSGLFLLGVGIAIVLVLDQFLGLAVPLFLFAAMNMTLSLRTRLSLGRANLLALTGHIAASVVSYLILTRVIWVVYRTDSIVATDLGVLKALSLENPYAFSIKPLLDQLAFPTSYYTPHLDGSSEFHLTYGALSFLSLLPMYLAGLHDLRDSVFIFHILSVLIVFGIVPARRKALSIAPFVFFPVFVAASWTDAVWAFFLVLCPALWYKNRNLGLLMLALAGASKQIALIAAPLLLIRLWRETPSAKLRNTLVGVGILTAGFLGPSLPFILASPSQWWASTMLPYFPGAAAMVSGGIGLSEILMDFGFAPPALYFMILMGFVGGCLLYLYATRFWKSKSLVWVFPVITILFYYRSFPNYIFYWGFPLALEYFRGKPRLVIWPFSPFQVTPLYRTWRNICTLTSRFRVGILLCILVTAVVLGAYSVYSSKLSPSMVDVRINSISDPDHVGAVTSLNLTLVNPTARLVLPLFFVKWGIWLPNLWASNSNHTLAQSSSASYIVTATDGFAMVPKSYDFRIYVFDAQTGDFVGSSNSINANTPLPALANPFFRWWTLDLGAGIKLPIHWTLTTRNVASVTPVAQSLDHTGQAGLQLQLNDSSSMGEFEQVMVSQEAALSSTKVNISILDPLAAESNTAAESGVTVTDGVHELVYIFSATPQRQTLSTYHLEETIAVPVSPSSWTSVAVDPNHDWIAQGWGIPRQVTLTIFLRASAPGFYSASLREITCTSCV